MPNLHPVMVHFTIALFATSVAFDVLGHFTKKESLKSAGWWNLFLATFAAIAAVITGLLAANTLPHTDEIHNLMETHEILGLIVLGAIVVLFVWRIFCGGTLPTRLTGLFLVFGLIAVSLMFAGGYYGGEMVYNHGMGVAPMMEQMAQQEQAGHAHESIQERAYVIRPENLYTCPMHPEVREDQPGECPICKMPLEKAVENGEKSANKGVEEADSAAEKSGHSLGEHGHEYDEHAH